MSRTKESNPYPVPVYRNLPLLWPRKTHGAELRYSIEVLGLKARSAQFTGALRSFHTGELKKFDPRNFTEEYTALLKRLDIKYKYKKAKR